MRFERKFVYVCGLLVLGLFGVCRDATAGTYWLDWYGDGSNPINTASGSSPLVGAGKFFGG